MSAMAFAIATLAVFALGMAQPQFLMNTPLFSDSALQFVLPCVILFVIGAITAMTSRETTYRQSYANGVFTDTATSSTGAKIGSIMMLISSYLLIVYGLGNQGAGALVCGILFMAVALPFVFLKAFIPVKTREGNPSGCRAY